MIGTILGNRYEIEEIIGSGGMAIVYKATDRLLNRYVAIKMLREELKDDKEFVERFRVEAQSAASLNHSNIVSVYDVGQENGMDYFVMEYIDGSTLKERIQAGPIGWKTACKYAAQICDAIEHAHRKNIVHRDIKPHNIMLTKDDTIKVTDFGIARAVSSSTIVRQGNVIGSVHYFSPEQACGGAVDFKSDIYSIGVVLYEMLTGRVPFDAENPVAVAKMQVDMQPEPPEILNPTIPKQLGEIVLKAMSKQPAKRYASAADFAEDLRKVVVSPASVVIADEDATKFIPVINPNVQPREAAPFRENIQPSNEPKAEEKGKKNYAAAWIASAAVLIICVFTVFYFIGSSAKNDEDIPYLVGKDYQKVVKEYTDESFKIELESEKNSDEEAGTIISQKPETGKVSNTPVIKVVVSKGKGSIVLDNYVGKDVDEVRKELKALKFTNVSVEYDSHATYPKNTVYKQSPGKGSNVRIDEKITIYVSTGNDDIKVKVPLVTGYTKSVARSTLEAVGLKLGEIQLEHSAKPEGEVIEQVIVAGTEVKVGTSISITVSLGPEATAKPTPVATPKPTPPATAEPASTPQQASAEAEE